MSAAAQRAATRFPRFVPRRGTSIFDRAGAALLFLFTPDRQGKAATRSAPCADQRTAHHEPIRAVDHFVVVNRLRIRYLAEGQGPAALLLHGASLGSSADVWMESMPRLAAYGLRVIAFDQPGFGLSDNPADPSIEFRQRFILAFMDAMRLERAHIIGHSQSGRMAVSLAFAEPRRIGKIIVLGTGSLLPPLAGGKKSAAEGEEGGDAEPTPEQTRKLLEANMYHHELITPALVEARQRMSIGKNFQAFLARRHAPREKDKRAAPLWQGLAQVPVPVRYIYGRHDRGNVAERVPQARELYPAIDLHVIDRCKHLIPIDAAKEFAALAGPFLTG